MEIDLRVDLNFLTVHIDGLRLFFRTLNLWRLKQLVGAVVSPHIGGLHNTLVVLVAERAIVLDACSLLLLLGSLLHNHHDLLHFILGQVLRPVGLLVRNRL